VLPHLLGPDSSPRQRAWQTRPGGVRRIRCERRAGMEGRTMRRTARRCRRKRCYTAHCHLLPRHGQPPAPLGERGGRACGAPRLELTCCVAAHRREEVEVRVPPHIDHVVPGIRAARRRGLGRSFIRCHQCAARASEEQPESCPSLDTGAPDLGKHCSMCICRADRHRATHRAGQGQGD
jgi:hypothetical protein